MYTSNILISIIQVVRCPVNVVPDMLGDWQTKEGEEYFFTRLAFTGHMLVPLVDGEVADGSSPSQEQKEKLVEDKRRLNVGI